MSVDNLNARLATLADSHPEVRAQAQELSKDVLSRDDYKAVRTEIRRIVYTALQAIFAATFIEGNIKQQNLIPDGMGFRIPLQFIDTSTVIVPAFAQSDESILTPSDHHNSFNLLGVAIANASLLPKNKFILDNTQAGLPKMNTAAAWAIAEQRKGRDLVSSVNGEWCRRLIEYAAQVHAVVGVFLEAKKRFQRPEESIPNSIDTLIAYYREIVKICSAMYPLPEAGA